MSIEKEFDQAMLSIYTRAKSEVKYNANIFYRMLSDRGGLHTAKFLVNAIKPSDGYTELYMRGRLDLTVEALIVDNPKWHSLFTTAEIEKARKRLADYRYFVGS